MKEDFEVQIAIKPGIYTTSDGAEYIVKDTAKNIENLEDYVVLQSLSNGKTMVCHVDSFLAPMVGDDESLITKFKVKRLF